MHLFTIFTPAYNRKHTLCRTFESLQRQTCKDFYWLVIDDGSTDGTREWVESLGEKTIIEGLAFDWMGRQLSKPGNQEIGNLGILDGSDHFVIDANGLHIEYVYKPNGGLYTGYNVAFAIIKTELCMCIDSDDYAPDDLVANVKEIWGELSDGARTNVAGIAGLAYNVVDGQPIGGNYIAQEQVAWIPDLHHDGDVKYVFRTEIIRKFAPQFGFEGEKDYNPHYMQMQVLDTYPMWVENKNLCWVEYQIGRDSMSQAIFKQYKRSPKSYARYRLMELSMKRGNSFSRKFSLSAHYVSACIFSHDSDWLKNCNSKFMTLLALPLGLFYNIYIRYKANQ